MFGPDGAEYLVYTRAQISGGYFVTGLLDTWRSLEVVYKLNDVHTFRLTMARSDQQQDLITDTSGIVITRNAAVIFSGQVTKSLSRTRRTVVAVGESDNVLLTQMMRPVPAEATAPFSADYDNRSGVCSTVLRALVNENIGPAAPALWKIPALTMATDPVVGTTVTSQSAQDRLIDVLPRLAIAGGGLKFDILQSAVAVSNLVFSVTVPIDRSASVIFDVGLNSAEDYNDTRSWPPANYFFVAADDGYGKDRTVREGGNSASILKLGYKITAFEFMSGVTDVTKIEQRLAELVAGAVPTRKVELTAFPTANNQFIDHYNLGDIVMANVEGAPIPLPIVEVHMTLVPGEGVKIVPLIGDTGTSNDDKVVSQLQAVQGRLTTWQQSFQIAPDSITRDKVSDPMKLRAGTTRMTFQTTAQVGWLLCQGQSVLRSGASGYPQLFSLFGTTYGSVDGTHFNMPDLRGRIGIGAGALVALGAAAGLPNGVANLQHNHGPNTLSLAHRHLHSHGPGTITIPHDHDVDIDHNHASFSSGGVNVDTVALGTASLGSGTSDHHHAVDVPALGTNTKTTSGAAHIGTRGGSTASDDSDVSSTQTSSGVTTDALGTSQNVLPPVIGLNWEVYTGEVI